MLLKAVACYRACSVSCPYPLEYKVRMRDLAEPGKPVFCSVGQTVASASSTAAKPHHGTTESQNQSWRGVALQRRRDEFQDMRIGYARLSTVEQNLDL